MTRQRREAREAAARDTGPSNMAAAAQQALPPDTPARGGGGKNVEAAARLQRFVRTPLQQTASPSKPQAPQWDAAGILLDTASGGQQDMSALLPPQSGEGEPEVCSPVPQRSEDNVSTVPTISDVFSAISSCNTSLATMTLHMGGLKADMALIRNDLQKINDRVEAAEGRISTVEDQLPSMQKTLKTATLQIAALLSKVDDLENRSRRSNIRLVGVPEKAEGRDPVAFLESWLSDTVGKDLLSPFFAIERSHRVPTRPLPPGAPPRPMLIKLLNFRDRDTLLRAARDKGDLSINGQRVSLFPDFSGEIQKKRMLFLDIKKRLRALGVPYSMQFPAKLRVVALNATHFFDSPKDALSWLDHNERSLRSTAHPD